MKTLILSVLAAAYLAGFSAVALAGVSGNKMQDGMTGKIEASGEAAKAKKDTMKDDMTAEGKIKTDAMNTTSLHHVRQTRLLYSPPCPPPDPVAGVDACGAIHGG